jgi:hypothetical protein
MPYGGVPFLFYRRDSQIPYMVSAKIIHEYMVVGYRKETERGKLF